MNKEERTQYNKKYWKKNKSRWQKGGICYKDRKEYDKQYKSKNRERLREGKMEERKRHREKYRIRGKTYRTYGRLPQGFEYHHTTKPYKFDVWIGVTIDEHRGIDNIYGNYKNKRSVQTNDQA